MKEWKCNMGREDLQAMRQAAAELQRNAVRAAAGDKEAMNKVLESLYPVIRKYARTRGGIQYAEDYFQEGRILAFELIKEKDPKKLLNFAGYFKVAFVHRLDELEMMRRTQENHCQSFETETDEDTPTFSVLWDEDVEAEMAAMMEDDDEEEDSLYQPEQSSTTRYMTEGTGESSGFLHLQDPMYYYHLRRDRVRGKDRGLLN